MKEVHAGYFEGGLEECEIKGCARVFKAKLQGFTIA